MTSEAANTAAALATAYLLGSIPFGFLLPLLTRGVDVRTLGSGNPGATNVYRVVGPMSGLAVGALDGLKGWVAVLAAGPAAAVTGDWVRVAAAVLAVGGHTWPAWTGFRGGKGVITTAGAFVRLAPWPLTGAVAVFAFVFWTTRMVAAGSIAAALVLPVLAFSLPDPAMTGIVRGATVIVALLVVVRHRSNLRRIIGGTEYRFRGRRR